MPDATFLDWPFFDEAHRALAARLDAWCAGTLAPMVEDETDADAAVRALVPALGAGGWLRYVVPAAHGGALPAVDARSLCLVRETLARWSGLADFAFAMQGLFAGPLLLAGGEALRARYLPQVASGDRIGAFAISEPDAGSDLQAMRTTARRDGDHFVLDGQKTWISNAGLAHHYVVFARWPEGGERAFVALVVDADAPGLEVSDKLAIMAPHPIGTITLDGCRVPAAHLIGEPGAGLKAALGTLDLFRPSVGAAALGFARRALDESLEWCARRQAFGKALAEHQLTQARLADMAVDIDASALLVYRAAWAAGRGGRTTREAAMAKLYATEAAQRVADAAVQLFGGRGVTVGETVERLYREVRALRIYEGTSEIQRLIIAGQLLRAGGEPA